MLRIGGTAIKGHNYIDIYQQKLIVSDQNSYSGSYCFIIREFPRKGLPGATVQAAPHWGDLHGIPEEDVAWGFCSVQVGARIFAIGVQQWPSLSRLDI